MTETHPRPQPSLDSTVERLVHAFRDQLSPGDVASLKRLDPLHPDVPAFFKLLAGPLEPAFAEVSPERLEAEETRWAAVVAGLANTHGLHRRGARLGRALADADVSEQRLLRLLRAHDAALFDLLRAATHQLASRGVPFDALQLAELVLSDGGPREESVRRYVARSYYQTTGAEASK